MLQIQHISKEYHTGKFTQKALDDVSLSLRDNEFVAVLGPSGSGKTTLLNIIGGLDRYDSGNLIINGISTQKYKDRDWDSYRNHTIGFVFQSYNLIPHQTILSNVELALTISGVDRTERRRRAQEALDEVGLGDQVFKKPNQLSGGQMQRVAIARALVNNPDILLADEPTGALDTDTSVQVMDLLKEVASDRLVVMVTHNPELADQYATRIVRLRDGKIQSDSDPYLLEEEDETAGVHKNMGKASMSFITSLSLSFNNLWSKKARTILTAFAGSIGIIGIALILSLSTGVNDYIQEIEEETLSEYPVTIQSTGFDFSSLMETGQSMLSGDEEEEDNSINVMEMLTTIFSRLDSNDLEALKAYFDSGESDINDYVKCIEYTYDITPQIFRQEENGDIRQVNPDNSFSLLGFGSGASSSSLMSSMMSTDMFYELPSNEDLYIDSYDVVAGRWPENEMECVLVLNSQGGISDFMLYTMGLRDPLELDEMIQQFINGDNVETPEDIGAYYYEDILGLEFKLVNSADYYEYDSEYDVWTDRSDNEKYMKKLVDKGEDLTIVGIVQVDEDATASILSSGVYYPAALIDHIVEKAADTDIVKAQIAEPDINIFTNEPFGEESDANNFDLNSLFDIDTEALQDALGFDTSALEDLFSGDALDASDLGIDMDSLGIDMGDLNLTDAAGLDSSSMDLSSLLDMDSLDLSDFDVSNMDLTGLDLSDVDLSGIDVSDFLGSIQINVSTEDFAGLANNLLAGYQNYAVEHPEADYSNLSNDFLNYLNSLQAQQMLIENIRAIIIESGDISVTTDDLQSLLYEILTGYEMYVRNQGYAPSTMDEYLLEYLGTPEANQILMNWTNQYLNLSDIAVDSAQIQNLAQSLVGGYESFVSLNGLADPTMIVDNFMAYLSSEEAQQSISDALLNMISLDDIQTQLGDVLQSYMETVISEYGSSIGSSMEDMMNSYGTVISEAIEAQMDDLVPTMMTQIEDQLSGSMESSMTQIEDQLSGSMESIMTQMMEQITSSLEESLDLDMDIDEDAFMDAFQFDMDVDELTELLTSLNYNGTATYDSNLQTLGYVNFDDPTEIDIYPTDFETKENVIQILDDYNARMEETGQDEQVITYTDMVGTLMSSVTDIINMISYVLIAFVGISLVVSSIMIGVVTYISVLERQKEIGILRAIGASKGNISQVFNAETFIIGLFAGVLGIVISLIALIPGNYAIHVIAGSPDVSAVLQPLPAILLILLSIVLTMIGGLIPSSRASNSDPVAALRNE